MREMHPTLDLVQRLGTSAARAVEPFVIDGQQYLAVAQMSMDVPGQKAGMNSGDSATLMPLYRWRAHGVDGQFELIQQMNVPGGEDAEFFCIGERQFLATASIRTGAGPYELNTFSTIFEWHGGQFEPFQTVPTFAAKQWRHFSIDGRHFLALAQGVVMDGAKAIHPAKSCIFTWDGLQFSHWQDVPSGWGYNWTYFTLGGRHFLAYADHAAASRILEWNGKSFETFQTLEGQSGRAFSVFQTAGEQWLAFANLLHDSVLHRWNGKLFERHQTLCGPGARELLWLPDGGNGFLMQANFMLGTREAPHPMLHSCAYVWQGNQLGESARFESSGAVDLASFNVNGKTCLAVANSLTADLRFSTDSYIYKMW
jgi:hypothetical protein